MLRFGKPFLLLGLLCFGMAVHAQTSHSTAGTLVIVPATAEVKQANDQAHITFAIEEQDKDKAAAASRVNQKMKQGTDIVRKEDPRAVLKTHGYYTYPVYPEDQPRGKVRQPVSWRVGQSLEVTTVNLDGLPKMVAAAQRVLTVNGLHFGLTDAAERKLDEKRIEATYRNLTARIAAIAKAMGRNPADAVLDTLDFEGSGAYDQPQAAAARMSMTQEKADAQVAEPSFEPGETTLQMRAVGKVRFK